MLQRIIHIRNVGRFRNCAAVGDVTFRRFTLIFAENGRGKTTLCAILRSLFTNTPGLVIGRTTLGGTGPPDLQTYRAEWLGRFPRRWSVAYPDIAVFDATYVSENLFAGDIIAVDQRRNLYRVIVGAQGVTLAARLNQLENEIKGKQTEIRENRTALQRHAGRG